MQSIHLNFKHIFKKIATGFLVALLVLVFSKPAFAATGILKQINFQGKVVNANGTNVTNGNYSFTFQLYTVSSGGTNIWTETKTTTVTDGIFRTALGDLTAFPGSVDFNTDNIYLGINFNSDGEMTPRVQFTAVPQAFNALKVAGLTVTDTTGTLTIPNSATITLQGTDTYVGRATTDTLTNKTIGSTGLTFSGATTDITTATGEDLTLVANGAGVLKLGDFTTANGVLYVSATDGTTAETAASTGAQCLQTTGAGLAPVWGGCGTGSGISTVRESDLSPSVGSLTTLEFGPATTSSDEFVVTDQTGGVARVVLGTKAVKTDVTQTLSNKTFSSDINFLDANPGTAYTVAGSDSTTAAVAGGDITLRAGAGLTTGGGGNLIVAGGTSPSGTAGYLALQTAGTERFRVAADGTFLFEKGANDVILSVTAPATATRTYTIPDFGANDSFVGLAATQALTGKTYNGLTVNTTTGTLAVTNAKTLTVSDSTTLGTNAITLAGGEVITFSATNALSLLTTGATSVTLPTSGTLVNSAVTTLSSLTTVGSLVSGTVLGSQTFTTNNIVDSGALTIKSGGTSALTLDTSGAAAINLGNTNATSLVFGNVTTNPTFSFNGSGLTTLGGGLTFSGSTARTITGPNTGAASALTITTAGNVSGLTLNTAAGSSGNSGVITIASGTVTTSGTSGAVNINSGASNTNTLNTGLILIQSGNITTSGTSGNVGLEVGTGGTLGTINIGNATAAPINIGTSTTAAKTIQIGTGAVANTITIGSASSTGVSITDDNWSVTAAGAATLVSATSPTYTGAGAVTLSSGGSSGLTFDSASGDITVAANDGLTFAATTLGNNGSRNVTINSGTGGTTATLLVKLDTSGTVVTTDTTTLNNAVGVATNTTTAGQAVRVAINGVVTATADNAVTAGDYIGLGTTTAGRAKSLGTTYPSTAGVQVIGRALGTQATPGSTFLLMLNGLDNNVAAGGGGGYNLIKDETTSLTARTTLAFLGTAVTCADNAGLTQTECTMSGAGGGVSFASGTPDNTVTSNNLIHLQKSGVNRFVVANTGGLTINGTDSSVVRTTTTEFATGALLTNLTNANDQLELSDGTAGNGTITTAGQPAVNVAIGAGAQAMTRADGKYQVIVGGGTALTTYDSIAGTFAASAQVLTGAAGAGALSLPRPDGRYRVIHGGGLTTTSLVDPNGVVAVGASVAVNASGNGTVAYRRANGRYLFTNGAAATATTQIYNPVTDAFVAGPTGTAGVWGIGALVLPRPDGQALIVQGGATATTQLYNPNSAVGDIGVFAVGPVLPTGCEINGAGSIAIRKQDGKYIVISKINSAAIYDPVANTWAQNGTSCTTPLAGKGPTVALADGAHAIPMQDGKFLIIIGGASTVANIYDPSTDTFTAHATAITAGGAGRHSIMRANGTWQLIAGGGTATNNFDTSLPVSGTYQSDDIANTSLNASSTLKWTAQYETPFTGTNAAANTAFSTLQFLVRTAANTAGLGAAVDREIITPGDFIRPVSTDAAIRMTVKFNRPLPKRIFDERGTWMGNGNTVTRLDFATPTLFDIAVDNSTVLRRNNFAFTEPNAQTAAPQNETSGPVATRVEAQSDRMYLPYGRLTQVSPIGVTGYYAGLTSGAHPVLSQTTTDGTIVIARPDRRFIVIAAGGAITTNTMMYDPAATTITTQTGTGATTAITGTGAHAIKRPDGKFLVVLGGATTTTNIYDPSANTFVAGPATTVAVGAGAMAIQNTDGTFTIVHGGAALTTSIYDPVRNTMLTGPASPTTAFNCGAMAIPRPGINQYLVFFGAAAGVIGPTTTSLYDAQLKIFSATTAAPTLTATQAVGCGAFAFQRPDGIWVIIEGGGGTAGAGQTATMLYNPIAQQLAVGFALPVLTLRGGHAIPRADGTFLIVNGNATTATQVYIPAGGTAAGTIGVPTGSFVSTGPVLQTAVGAGALSFQRPDGKWVVIVAGNTATATVNTYDAGWYPDGQYLSEQVQVPALAANSTLEWKQTPDNFVRMEVRVAASQAALGNAAYFTVGRPGQSIANAGGETWVQVEVNMRRDFPTFGGSLDGVYVSTGGMAYNYRNISVPTVFEYKLNNGMDLLNLQANGLNMLRVTSNGNIYSSSTGGFYSGGADLAENYTSKDSLEKGEVVAIDKTDSHSVKRSGGQYQNDILGIVSTAPGFVAGAYTDGAYPIALVGRVPVKVSTENGQIKAGDYLTSASIPGYAMKAKMAGRVLGKALEDLNPPAGGCPAFGLGNLPKTKCGEVMMFVNLTDYLGSPVELVMVEKNYESGIMNQGSDTGLVTPDVILANEVRPESDSGVVAIAPPQNDNVSKQQQILAFLRQLKEEQASSSAGYRSEIFTDRVTSQEIIGLEIFADTLHAKKIKADSIEGLEILTDKISSLQGQVAGLSTIKEATSSAGLSTSQESVPATSEVIAQAGSSEVLFESGKFTLDLTVLGKLQSEGSLVVLGPAEFKGNVKFAQQTTFQGETIFEKLVTLISNVIFKGKVTFEEVPTFNKDTAGSAIITKDTDQVVIVFEKEYEQMPFVTVGITLDASEKNFADKTLEEQAKAQEILENDLLSYDLKYFVTRRSARGFVIKLNKKAPLDVPFSWHAIAVKDSIVFKSKPPVVEPTSVPSPSPTASPGTVWNPASPTIEPSITPSQEATSSATTN